MHSFALLLGHLLGDYIFQRDWEAGLKSVHHPTGPRPEVSLPSASLWVPVGLTEEEKAQKAWDQQAEDARIAPKACLLHCLLYTLAVFCTCCWFLPWWAYLVVFVTHYPVDRYRLARKFMTANGQEAFATGVFSPWSIIVVDNIIHLAVLYVLGLIAVL